MGRQKSQIETNRIVFLPDDNSRGCIGYDKSQVLTYLMIHDLAESIAGDASPLDSSRAQASKDNEREAFKYLMMSRTYRGVADLAHYYRLWKAFEDGVNESARIARDLDKLENLTQLYLYGQEVDIEDQQRWQNALKESISTEIGEEILAHLQDYFESGETS
jgi:5'-deoxynucleotidase YfbR-like HD superfamily hydrolase